MVWLGKAINKSGGRSLPHHHGEAETSAYVLSGKVRMYYGEGFRQHIDLSEGDYMFVPPDMPHIEANMSTEEALHRLTSHTPQGDFGRDSAFTDDRSIS